MTISAPSRENPVSDGSSHGRGSRPGHRKSLPRRAGERPWRPSPTGAAITSMTLLALVVRFFLFTRPGSLTGVVEYDDGPYSASAVELVHGVLPYRGFVFVQPPGITLLMAPVALLAKVTGTTVGMAAGRIATALASAAGVALAGLAVRRRGPLAVVCVSGLLAVYPASVAASHTVLVEPWLVLACLAGMLAVFDGDRLTPSARRLAAGGLAFGLAGAIEAWAIVPVAVLAVLLAPRPRRAAWFAGGVTAGFCLCVGPFVALAPRAFYTDVVIAQIGHRPDAARVSLMYRLHDMTGLFYVRPWSDLATLMVVLLTAGVIAFAMVIAGLARRLSTLEWFAAATASLVAAVFLWPSQFHYHFPAFLAPYLALVIGLPVATCAELAHRGLASVGAGNWVRPAAVSMSALAVAGMAVLGVYGETGQAPFPVPVPHVRKVIPAGACVLSDQVSYLIVADRFYSSTPGCPVLLDSLGADLALSHGLKPETGAWKVAAVERMWYGAFSRASFVWWSPHSYRRVAWTPWLRAYFHARFTPLFRDGNQLIYGLSRSR
jgi:glycosyl transferase family 87